MALTFSLTPEQTAAHQRHQEILASPGRECRHPDCTGVHDNNRYHQLCPAALERKRERDNRWHSTPAGSAKRHRAYMAALRARIGAKSARLAAMGETSWTA
jgi:hypothetical protein